MIGDIAHVFNRGVLKQPIFFHDGDYIRFLETLFKVNNKSSAIRSNSKKFFSDPPPQNAKIVEILKWTLMPNHYHLLLYEVSEGGIIEFIKRLGNSYTKYINIKYDRSGYLFQNTAKVVLVKNDAQFLYIPHYIDLNVLDIKFPNWKKFGLRNSEQQALDFIRTYQWSSFQSKNFSCVGNEEFFYEIFDIDKKRYESELVKLMTSKNKHVNVAG